MGPVPFRKKHVAIVYGVRIVSTTTIMMHSAQSPVTKHRCTTCMSFCYSFLTAVLQRDFKEVDVDVWLVSTTWTKMTWAASYGSRS